MDRRGKVELFEQIRREYRFGAHYVGRRKRELGLAERETFVPQTYDWEASGAWPSSLGCIGGLCARRWRALCPGDG